MKAQLTQQPKSKIKIPDSVKNIITRGSPNTKENVSQIKSNLLKCKKAGYKSKISKNFGSPLNENAHPEDGSPSTTKNRDNFRNFRNKYFDRSKTPPENKEQSGNLLHSSKLLQKIKGSPSNKTDKSSGRSKSNAQVLFEKHEIGDNMSSFSTNKDAGSPGKILGYVSKGSPGSPGSPSHYSVDHLLDVSKYAGEMAEANGDRVTANCINHPMKRAKYCVNEDAKLLSATGKSLPFLRGLCSKCAVYLGQLGFKCDELDFGQEKLDVIKMYLRKQEEVESYYSKVLRVTNSHIQALQVHYENEFNIIEDFENSIDHIINMLQENKQKMRNIMMTESQKEMERFTDMKVIIEEDLLYFENTRLDLETNINSILRDFNINKIETILTGYNKTLEQMMSNISGRTNSRATVLRIERVDHEVMFNIGTQMSKWFNIDQGELKPPNPDVSFEQLSNLADYEDEYNEEVSPLQTLPTKAKKKSKQNAVYISFEDRDKFESALWKDKSSVHSDKGEEAPAPGHVRKNSTSKYISILDKITESQNEKNSFYTQLVGKSGGEDDDEEPLFVITPNDKDFVSKKTPELRQKEVLPDHMKQAFEGKQAQPQANLNEDELFNFIGKKEGQVNKCQKILFDVRNS